MKTLSLVVVVVVGVFFAQTTRAYTGAYGIFPAAIGGPGSITVTNFPIDTSNGPATITANLTYVQSVVIETSQPIHSHLLIKEYPSGSDPSFDFIVPQSVQDVLVQATVYIWAPDTETLVIRHEHNGAPTTYENAEKVYPLRYDANGNILWSFSVTSFSHFTPFETIQQSLLPSSKWDWASLASFLLILALSVAAPLAFRRF